MLNDILRELQNLNSKLDGTESHDTHDSLKEYKCQDNYRTCSKDDYKDNRACVWRTTKKEKIKRKFRFKEPKFYSYPDPHAFRN